MEQVPVEITFLMTKEDYIQFKLDAANLALRKPQKRALRIIGLALALLGVLGKVLMEADVYMTLVFALLILVGLCMAAFSDVLYPYVVKKAARKFCETHGEKLVSSVMTFSQDFVEIQTDRYQAKIPYEKLYKVGESKTMLLFYIGISELRFLPKRAAEEQELSKITALLKQKLQNRYAVI